MAMKVMRYVVFFFFYDAFAKPTDSTNIQKKNERIYHNLVIIQFYKSSTQALSLVVFDHPLTKHATNTLWYFQTSK